MPKKMPDYGRIKFRLKGSKGEYRYGEHDTYSDDVKKEWAKGYIIVEDAITPQAHALKVSDCEIVKIPYGNWDNDEYWNHLDEELKKAQEKSEAVKNGYVGKLFSLGVADGCAYYVVIKETARKVKVEWRGFCPDRYVDQILGYGGTFDKNVIVPHIERQEAMAKLFS
jgi:hypothetical protein